MIKVLIAALLLVGVGGMSFALGRQTAPRVTHYRSENSELLVCRQAMPNVMDCFDFAEVMSAAQDEAHGGGFEL